jgi:hypothetical protein
MSYQEASQDVLSCPGHPMVFTDLVPSVLGARCSPDGGWHQPGGVPVPPRSARRRRRRSPRPPSDLNITTCE